MTSEEQQALGKRLHIKILDKTFYPVQVKDGLFYYKDMVMNERAFKRWIKTLTVPATIIMTDKEDEV